MLNFARMPLNLFINQTFILKVITGSFTLSMQSGFAVVQPSRRSERRQIGDPPTTFGHYLTFVGPPSHCLGFYFYFNHDTFNCARAVRYMRYNGWGAEVKGGGKLLRGKETSKKWFSSSQVQLKSRLFRGRVALESLGGMDTHVKEGQLYVQHQKFGKVSPIIKKQLLCLTEMRTYNCRQWPLYIKDAIQQKLRSK